MKDKDKDKEDLAAVDISDIEAARGQYICPNCDVFMDPRRIIDLTEYVCPSCGMIKNPLTDSMKHGSKLIPAITEDMITEQEDMHIFATVEDDSGFGSEPKEEPNEILEQDKQQDEAWRKKGFKVTTI